MWSGPVAVIIFPKDVSSLNYNDIKQALPSFAGFSLSIVHNDNTNTENVSLKYLLYLP